MRGSGSTCNSSSKLHLCENLRVLACDRIKASTGSICKLRYFRIHRIVGLMRLLQLLHKLTTVARTVASPIRSATCSAIAADFGEQRYIYECGKRTCDT